MATPPRSSFILPSPGTLAKWCAIALVLVTPGSFVVLPAIWLARNWHRVKELEARTDWGEVRERY